jgi:hypothetical protein
MAASFTAENQIAFILDDPIYTLQLHGIEKEFESTLLPSPDINIFESLKNTLKNWADNHISNIVNRYNSVKKHHVTLLDYCEKYNKGEWPHFLKFKYAPPQWPNTMGVQAAIATAEQHDIMEKCRIKLFQHAIHELRHAYNIERKNLSDDLVAENIFEEVKVTIPSIASPESDLFQWLLKYILSEFAAFNSKVLDRARASTIPAQNSEVDRAPTVMDTEAAPITVVELTKVINQMQIELRSMKQSASAPAAKSKQNGKPHADHNQQRDNQYNPRGKSPHGRRSKSPHGRRSKSPHGRRSKSPKHRKGHDNQNRGRPDYRGYPPDHPPYPPDFRGYPSDHHQYHPRYHRSNEPNRYGPPYHSNQYYDDPNHYYGDPNPSYNRKNAFGDGNDTTNRRNFHQSPELSRSHSQCKPASENSPKTNQSSTGQQHHWSQQEQRKGRSKERREELRDGESQGREKMKKPDY